MVSLPVFVEGRCPGSFSARSKENGSSNELEENEVLARDRLTAEHLDH